MTLARIVRPHGIRGEVVAEGDPAQAQQFTRYPRVFLHPEGGQVVVESARAHDGRLLLKLRGVDSMDEAGKLRGREMRIPLEDRPPAQENEVYYADLVGCRLIDRATGEDLGAVTGWQSHGGPVLLEVERAGPAGPMLVPFAASICREVDVAGKRILADLPEGLKELP